MSKMNRNVGMVVMYAEDLPYWKTGQSSPDTWIERTIKVVTELGGKVLMEAFGRDDTGQSAFLLNCRIGAETYRIVWPVMRSKSGNGKAAKIQAATMLYHDIKARAVSAAILGIKASFFTYLELPSGMTPVEAYIGDVSDALKLFALPPGEEVVDGDYKEQP